MDRLETAKDEVGMRLGKTKAGGLRSQQSPELSDPGRNPCKTEPEVSSFCWFDSGLAWTFLCRQHWTQTSDIRLSSEGWG